MELKSRIERQLKKVREVSETFLSAFQTPEQWTYQVHDKANHALWFAGHLGTVDNFMLSLVAPQKAAHKPGYQEKFGRKPNRCYVHPECLPEGGFRENGIKVVTSPGVLPHHFWVGVGSNGEGPSKRRRAKVAS